MKLPLRPMMLIREFCKIKEMDYRTTESSWRMRNVFHRLHCGTVLTYELIPESGVIRVSSRGRRCSRGPCVDTVVVLESGDSSSYYSMGLVDRDHVVTLSHSSVSTKYVASVWRLAGAATDAKGWALVEEINGERNNSRWEICSAHPKGVTIMTVTPSTTRPRRLLEWDWQNGKVVYHADAEQDQHALDKIRGYGFHSGLCQIRNTRFLDNMAVELECVTSFDLGGMETEMYLSIPELKTGRISLRSHSGSLSASSSVWLRPGTTHILESNPLHPPMYIQMCESIGFMILDVPCRTMRHFALADLVDEWRRGGERRSNYEDRWVRQVGGADRVMVVSEFSSTNASWSVLPIEIDGGEDWMRLAVFGGTVHYVVDIRLDSWKAQLLGFFKISDEEAVRPFSTAFHTFPSGLILFDDPHVSILQELNL